MRNILLFIYGSVIFSIVSCKTEEMLKPQESFKDISGSWQIVKAVQNTRDLTADYDFSNFRIHFTENSHYEIENYVPFIVKQNGTFSLDDGQYTFQIDFNQEGSETPVSSTFDYPVIDGVRSLRLMFSPGCVDNTYIYTLKKIEP